jgi:two-component system chemotaxis sensor kinase CheA
VESGTSRAALGVDRLIGISHVAQRPLPALAPTEPYVAGVALDAEGVPLLVLDSQSLVAAAGLPLRASVAPALAVKRPILVIDDSLTTRMLEQSILQTAGYEVELACSAEEALEKARQCRYALFLVDVEMPGMDGFGFVEVTRADPLLRDVPAILVTSRNEPEDRRRGREAGAAGYVVKSEFDQIALLERIRGLVE